MKPLIDRQFLKNTLLKNVHDDRDVIPALLVAVLMTAFFLIFVAVALFFVFVAFGDRHFWSWLQRMQKRHRWVNRLTLNFFELPERWILKLFGEEEPAGPGYSPPVIRAAASVLERSNPSLPELPEAFLDPSSLPVDGEESAIASDKAAAGGAMTSPEPAPALSAEAVRENRRQLVEHILRGRCKDEQLNEPEGAKREGPPPERQGHPDAAGTSAQYGGPWAEYVDPESGYPVRFIYLAFFFEFGLCFPFVCFGIHWVFKVLLQCGNTRKHMGKTCRNRGSIL